MAIFPLNASMSLTYLFKILMSNRKIPMALLIDRCGDGLSGCSNGNGGAFLFVGMDVSMMTVSNLEFMPELAGQPL
jgi:hypothetical protein